MKRRALLLAAPAVALAQPEGDDDAVRAGRELRFPHDHGAHPGSRTEWWYATGALQGPQAPIGFQVTFFRHRTGLAEALPGRFAPRQLLFAHAALSDVAARTHRQAQRAQRWSGDERADDAYARRGDTDVRLGHWFLHREASPSGGRYRAHVGGADAPFDLRLELVETQPLLLQGTRGFSRKGPEPQQASLYYSVPQLQVRAQLDRDGRRASLQGRAWLDHEWSDEYLSADAVGWDWIGFNLDDGAALMAFRLRRADGSALWAGGSHRGADGRLRVFAPDEVRFTPQRWWTSAASQARYPVQWSIDTPAGRWSVRALLDSQELDGRLSNGAVYWEGLSDLLDEHGRRVGRGYLEMTGYAGRLAM
ncbi:MAG TPA: carotenoid 1,2-hydratase [Burkholderiaceae bacterium]|nr:carotenoid 1,2-hydratase [Burkholderiaceae bacterium]